ncbi:hypothetical protein MMC07_002428 [Pseudocyphellaria aurata]|nr:hypothetical protein [Pseudocyphellaria aurata]
MESDGENLVDDVPVETEVSKPIKKSKKRPPQVGVDEFWAKFQTTFPGKVDTILPKNIYAKTKAAKNIKGTVPSQGAGKSYEEASAECIATVDKIAAECRRVNLRYRDPHFDIEWDLKRDKRDCLDGLVDSDWDLAPRSVKRVAYIFDNPVFYQEGATASDIRQGNNGDCWFMSALCALGNKKNLIDKVCVHRDEQILTRKLDGEWIQTIIDDKLYLIAADFDESDEEKRTWQQVSMQDPEEEYRKSCQNGSRALYFAQCTSENETWLPLLEKAYAKAHGDFNAIQGGFTGEAVEDLTGGVTTELFTSDILDTDKFWSDEIMKVNNEFLFGCATGVFDNWRGTYDDTERTGIKPMHAYSIMEAREVKGEKLLRVRNPWGRKEWNGPWSDGSEQWTPEWMQLLNHKFGDDGIFWMSYKDLLRKYQSFDRTRLFGPEWSITQQWTTVEVPWSADYNDTKFNITLTKTSPVVIVLSQLDQRYFQGLEGQYYFSLHFRLEKEGGADYIVRSHGNYLMRRSVSVDLELEAGTYSVLMKITAERWSIKPSPEQVIRDSCRGRQQKLIQIGLAYDLAHAKGQIKESNAEKQLRKEREERKKAAAHKQRRKEFREQKFKEWQTYMKQKARDTRHAKRKEERQRKRAESNKAAAGTEGSVPGEAHPLKTDAAVDTPAITVSSDAKQKLASPSGVENEPSKSECEAVTLPSPPADTQPTEHPDATNGALTEEATMEEQSQKFQVALQSIPTVRIDGASAPASAPAPNSTTAPPSTAGPPTSDSDYDSDASFNSSIDSDLDFPPSPIIAAVGAPATTGDDDDDDDGEDVEFENDPWNAVCVVGLRVYSKDQNTSIQVIRPKEDDDSETPLDVDDISKGASGEKVEDQVTE